MLLSFISELLFLRIINKSNQSYSIGPCRFSGITAPKTTKPLRIHLCLDKTTHHRLLLEMLSTHSNLVTKVHFLEILKVRTIPLEIKTTKPFPLETATKFRTTKMLQIRDLQILLEISLRIITSVKTHLPLAKARIHQPTALVALD